MLKQRVPANRHLAAVAASWAALALAGNADALPAFPGAEGYGATATGGRGGEVFHVNSLAATSTGTYEGPNGNNRGTLRWCLTTETSTLPRTIVFDVSGQVTLTSQITLEGSNITVAGQTAPGQGVTIAGRQLLVESSNDLIIRYIRGRLGRNGGNADTTGVEGGNRIIFDHVTASWSGDEGLSVAKDGNFVTVQNSFIYEALNYNSHSYGSLIRPDIDSNVTYHHNLYADNVSRNPRPGTYNSKTLEFDFINNVIYNWRDRAGYSGGSSEGNPEHVNMNYLGNYVIAGPSTTSNANYAFITDVNADTHAYQAGNLIDSDNDLLRDGVDTGWGMFHVSAGSLTMAATPFAHAAVTTDSAADAYAKVLAAGGAFPWSRDASDARIVAQVKNQTGAIINHQDDVGGYPALPTLTRPANWDTDYDGMPDWWETARGLNPAAAPDHNGIGPNGYTNLENYLNYLTLIANWNLDANGNWSAYLNWLGDRPGVMDSTANFLASTTGPRTVTVDMPVTLGQLNFDGTNSYTLAGPNTITMDVISGKASIGVNAGNHTISAALALADSTEFSMAAGSALTVANLQATNAAVTKSGTGMLTADKVRASALTITSGTIRVIAGGGATGVSHVNTLSIAPSAALDLNDNDLVVNGGVFSTIQNLVFAGYSSTPDAAKTGIISSTGQTAGNTILALFDNSTIGITDWAGQTVGPNAIIGKYTYFGDADFNGQVTGDDYLVLDANLNTAPAPGVAWISGDMNLDGTVTGDDYLICDANLGLGVGNPLAPGGAAVPEPATIALCALGALGIGHRRRR